MKRSRSVLLLATLLLVVLTVATSTALAAAQGASPAAPVFAAEQTGTPTPQPEPTNPLAPLGSMVVIKMGGGGRVTVANSYAAAVLVTIEGKTYTVPANAKDFQIDLSPGAYAWTAVIPGVAQGSGRFAVSTDWSTTLILDAVSTSTPAPTSVAAANTPTLTPTRPATPTGTPATETSLVFADDFSAATCTLATADDAERKFGCENGVYSMLSKKGDASWWQYYRGQFNDMIVEADGQSPTGDTGVTYGIVFRLSSNGNAFYLFDVSPAGKYSLYHFSRETKWTALIPYTASEAIKTGAEWNRLKVVAQGSQIAVYVNDQFLDAATDSKLTSGSVGFIVNTDNPNGHAAFDNLRVLKINRPLTLPAARERPPTPTPMPTIPAGMGGVVVINYFGFEAYFEIAGTRYTVPANDRLYIHLPPGKYPISVTAAGKGLQCTGQCSVEVKPGLYTPWSMG